MKRAALYLRVSTLDQHPETQLHDLEQMAAQRGYTVVQQYTDRISGAKARRLGLDAMMMRAAAASMSSGDCGVGRECTPLKTEAVQFDSEMATPAKLN